MRDIVRRSCLALVMALGVVLGISIAPGAASANQFVVVVSTEAGWKPGQIVAVGTAFDVPAGGKITLVGADGRTLHIRGPYKGTPVGPVSAAGGGEMVERLAALVARDRSDSSALGAMRVAPVDLTAGRDPLTVEVTRPGVHCVGAAKPISLWRAANARPASGTIRRIGTDEQGAIRWQTGNRTIAWPQGVTAQAGARYVIRLQDRPQPTEIELKVVPADLPSAGHKALWMNEQGCAEQARLLLQTED